MIWLALGSGPSAPIGLDQFGTSGITVNASITCNAGIKLLPRPTVYVAVDQIASTQYAEAASEAQQAGTLLACLRRDPAAMRERKNDHYDLIIDDDPKSLPHVGGYGRFRYSGPLMLEIALNQGATELHLVGFDGYSPDTVNYFDHAERGWLATEFFGKKQANSHFCHLVTQEAFGRIASAWSHCRFVQHGPTRYVVDSPNWERLT